MKIKSLTKTEVFILFLFISLVDLFCTLYGIYTGAIKEQNFFYNFLVKNSIFNVYTSIIYCKITVIMAAYWFLTQLYLQKQKERLTFKMLSEEKILKRILLILTIITAVFGAIPAWLINIHHAISN